MTLQGANIWKHQDGQLATAEIIKGLAEGKVCVSMHAMSVLPCIKRGSPDTMPVPGLNLQVI